MTQFIPHAQVTIADFGYPVKALWLSTPKYFGIICRSNLLSLSVPDECYSRNASCALLMSMFLLQT